MLRTGHVATGDAPSGEAAPPNDVSSRACFFTPNPLAFSSLKLFPNSGVNRHIPVCRCLRNRGSIRSLSILIMGRRSLVTSNSNSKKNRDIKSHFKLFSSEPCADAASCLLPWKSRLETTPAEALRHPVMSHGSHGRFLHQARRIPTTAPAPYG